MLGESDSIAALIWASTIGWLVSMGLVLSQSILDLTEAMDAWIEGMKDVIAPMIVLLLAWALGDVIGKAKAADFLSKALQGSLPKWALPALISLLAHAISYACGSSFGTCIIMHSSSTHHRHALSTHLTSHTLTHLPPLTGTMGIILPLVGPLATNIGKGDEAFLRHCIGSALGGALFGNICSPISDTTILSVLATKCDLQAHVATITPYAGLGAAVAIVLGSLPVGLGLYGPFTALILSIAAIYAVITLLGTPAGSGGAASAAAATEATMPTTTMQWPPPAEAEAPEAA